VSPGEGALATPAKQVDGHFDAIATDLHCRLARYCDEVLSKSHACVENALACSISKNSLALDVRLLINVKLGLLEQSRSAACKGNDDDGCELHALLCSATRILTE